MPLEKMDKFERYEAISLRVWKDKESKIMMFMDGGKDVMTENGEQVVHTVKLDGELRALWVKPGGSLHMGLNDFIPLEGKTLVVTKDIMDGNVLKGTRYSAVLNVAVEKEFFVDEDVARARAREDGEEFLEKDKPKAKVVLDKRKTK